MIISFGFEFLTCVRFNLDCAQYQYNMMCFHTLKIVFLPHTHIEEFKRRDKKSCLSKEVVWCTPNQLNTKRSQNPPGPRGPTAWGAGVHPLRV